MLIYVQSTMVWDKPGTNNVPRRSWLVISLRYSNKVVTTLYMSIRSEALRRSSKVGQFSCSNMVVTLVGF